MRTNTDPTTFASTQHDRSRSRGTPGDDHAGVRRGGRRRRIAGLYALHHLRELGFSVRVLEAGDGVGGTWYWNRYPGARCDVPSLEYSYGFSEELEQEWEWIGGLPRAGRARALPQPRRRPVRPPPRHPARHPRHRRDVRRGRRRRWSVETEHGERFSARFCVMATGPPVGADRARRPRARRVRGPRAPDQSRGRTEGSTSPATRIGLIGTGRRACSPRPSSRRSPATSMCSSARRRSRGRRATGRSTPRCSAASSAIPASMRRQQRRGLRAGSPARRGDHPCQLPGDAAILEATEEERLAMLDELGSTRPRVERRLRRPRGERARLPSCTGR